MRAAAGLGLGLGVLLALAGCGRVGPIRAPGPASEIIYPRPYPYFPRDASQQAPSTSEAGRSSVPDNLPVARPASPR
ncbi:hypothetical protein [Roseomonas chloroacetimidivorans]|jgi:hypothetical protein|uniref:hypothetical protein n=1 Tax=Roseomonas chloroacetimidivorans TaxID=1766656 RepID=UPI003C72E255